MSKFLFLFFASSLLISCGEKTPKDVLPQDKMATVLLDYLKVDNYAFDHLKNDSTINDTVAALKMQKAVFAKHKVSREAFEKSINYYADHPKTLNVILDSVINRQMRKDTTKKPTKVLPVIDNL